MFIRMAAFLAVLSLTSSVVPANPRSVVTVDDDVYKRAETLCRDLGVISPSSYSPMPASVLELALSRIDRSALDADSRAELDSILAELSGENDKPLVQDGSFTFDADGQATLWASLADWSDYDYSNASDGESTSTDRHEDTLIPYRHEPALASLDMEFTFSDSAALDTRFDLKNNHLRMYETSLGGLVTWQPDGELKLGSGVLGDIPLRGGFSMGGDNVSLILGRYPHSMGSGVTGNLIVGDNFSYQEILSLSFNSRPFTYSMSITHFDVMDEVTGGDGTIYGDFSRNKFDGDQQYRVVHRFDFVIADKFRLALDLSTIYLSQYGFDFRYLFPFVLGHNYNNYNNSTTLQSYDEANNLLGFTVEWAVTPGISLSIQLAFDQFQTFIEDASSVPSAYGALANIKGGHRLREGRTDWWGEAVYTNPYLYLNGKYVRNGDGTWSLSPKTWNLDYIVGYNMVYMDDYGYSGYVYGPDCIVLSLGADYKSGDGRFKAGGSFLYRAKGEKGISHSWRNNNNVTWIDMSDAVVEREGFMDNTGAPSGGWANAEHYFKPEVHASWLFPAVSWLEGRICGALGANCYLNYDRNQGRDEFSPQLMFGLTFST